MILRGIFGRAGEPTAPPPAPPTELTFVERVTQSFEELRWRLRASGSRLPVEVLPRFGQIEDVVLPLLAHVARNAPSVEEEIAVQALLVDYLPTTVNRFLALNPQFVDERRADGRSSVDDLVDQLVALHAAARDLSRAIALHDAADLEAQGRFLRAKFDRSGLALP